MTPVRTHGDNSAREPPLAPRDPLHALCLTDVVWAERYEGWAELGRGGSATVVRTFSRASGEDLALKIFQRLEDDDQRRFQQEVRHAQRLASPCVVRTYSPFVRGSLSWIEMEWVDGVDLRRELQRRERAGQPFALDEAHRLGAALAQALRVAHEGAVVHRDVKPANVLLPSTGTPAAKLGDFGISRVADAARVTATGLLAGTPQFAAPEIIAGQPADACSDVYSLALVLYLVFSGNRFPYAVADPESPAQWLRAHAQDRPLSLRKLRSDAPESLDALLLRALAKEPSQRPSAAQFLELLDPAACAHASAVTSARPMPNGTRQVAFVAGLALVAALAVVLTRPAPVAAPEAPSNPAPTIPPAETPGPAPAAALEATLSGDLLTLANRGGPPLVQPELQLHDAGGRTYRARLATSIGSNEEVALALDAFVPAPALGSRLVSLDVGFGAGVDRTQRTVTLR
jgi:eukaryotic-like serine/threonine-protein kinase